MAEKKDVRVQLVMSAAEMEALDAWRFPRRIGSRSDAIRRLVAAAVERDDPAPPPGPDLRRKDARRERARDEAE